MKKVALLFLAVYSGLISGVVPSASAANPSGGFAFTDKVVLAYYYIWYDEGKWIKTAAEGGRREGLEGLHPLVGAYNSWDPTIIDKHLEQMNRALIDAVAVSWWYDTKANGTNDILDTVFEKAAARGLKVTIDYEHGRAELQTVNHDLFYFLNRYKDHPAMLKVEGRPVVMIWTAWAHTPAQWQGVFDKLEKAGINAFPIMSGSYQNGRGRSYLGPFRSLADFMKTMRGHIDEYNRTKGLENGKPAQHHATISPGYDETRNPGRKTSGGGYKGAGWKDRTKFGVNYPDNPDGAYYRGTFEAAMSSNPDWLHISTFNELYEFSHIEATFEHGYKYIDLTAEFVREFKGLKQQRQEGRAGANTD
ncbi:MAG: hypothetical protein AMJ65_09020 [Phycisphaerae bacterium SG8_4]|nr:MAG: hypothetical protein AMJ65_09020 [Phycisphaerae bacterium SG8_4]